VNKDINPRGEIVAQIEPTAQGTEILKNADCDILWEE
jgi:hypothetical protein